MNTPTTFHAYLVRKNKEEYVGSIEEIPFTYLPENEVLIRVIYSSLNYKDALSASGLNNVTKNYPHIPGIDAVGTVISDSTQTYSLGDSVIVTGHDLGTNSFGGYSEYIFVPKKWIVPLPDCLTAQQSMLLGTAGFTAMYGIKRLQRELIFPESGPILVTGATGGVGSLAVFLLSKLGYSVVATTRKKDMHTFLYHLGAKSILYTDDLQSKSTKPLLNRSWAGCIETVGGTLLDSVLRQILNKGAVACCGNILGKTLSTNVYPFILRGISLLGIDSANCEYSLRVEIWKSLSTIDYRTLPEGYSKIVRLTEVYQEIQKILHGNQTGRVLVSI